jgi:hypothetical protein
MAKIILESARNGIIKKVIDNNHGGSGESWTSIDVYEETEQNNSTYIMKFFFDLCEDLGLNLGNNFEKDVITIKKEWGSHYVPTDDDIRLKIKNLEAELQLLRK